VVFGGKTSHILYMSLSIAVDMMQAMKRNAHQSAGKESI